jgi:hypothetical protein
VGVGTEIPLFFVGLKLGIAGIEGRSGRERQCFEFDLCGVGSAALKGYAVGFRGAQSSARRTYHFSAIKKCCCIQW